MGDTFTEGLPLDWLMPYMTEMVTSPHVWILLTKRPKRMAKFFEMLGYVPVNFWLGVSVTDQQTANALIPELLKINAGIRLLSVEPQLGPIDFGDWIGLDLVEKRIHWLINGGESGPGFRRFEWDWARSNLEQCRRAGVAYFCKQGGGYPSRREALFEIPEDLRIREMPINPMWDDSTPGACQPELFG
jgi:protein gp37